MLEINNAISEINLLFCIFEAELLTDPALFTIILNNHVFDISYSQ